MARLRDWHVAVVSLAVRGRSQIRCRGDPALDNAIAQGCEFIPRRVAARAKDFCELQRLFREIGGARRDLIFRGDDIRYILWSASGQT